MNRKLGTDKQKLNLPLMPVEVVFQALSGMGLVFMAVIFAVFYPGLPEIIPTHFNFAGEPDAWGGKGMLIVLLIVPFALFVLITVVERFPAIWNMPVRITKENAARQYTLTRAFLTLIKAEIVWVFAYILYATCQVAAGKSGGMGWWIYLFFGLIILIPIVLIIAAIKSK